MAPRYPTPNEQLLRLAAEAKRAGIGFEDFWRRVVPEPRRLVACRGCGQAQSPTRKLCRNPDCAAELSRSGEPLEEVDRDDNGLLSPSRPVPRVGDPVEGAILWPNDTGDRKATYTAIMDAEEGWRRAYEGAEARPRERALPRLQGILSGDRDREEAEVGSR